MDAQWGSLILTEGRHDAGHEVLVGGLPPMIRAIRMLRRLGLTPYLGLIPPHQPMGDLAKAARQRSTAVDVLKRYVRRWEDPENLPCESVDDQTFAVKWRSWVTQEDTDLLIWWSNWMCDAAALQTLLSTPRHPHIGLVAAPVGREETGMGQISGIVRAGGRWWADRETELFAGEETFLQRASRDFEKGLIRLASPPPSGGRGSLARRTGAPSQRWVPGRANKPDRAQARARAGERPGTGAAERALPGRRAERGGNEEGWCLRVGSPSEAQAAETRLVRQLVKPTDGFFSRHLDRKISLTITRMIALTPLTPNAMSWVTILIGLLGGRYLAWPGPQMKIVGAGMFLLSSIVDGCDGELARLRLEESRWGGWLDLWGDNVVHIAVFLGLGIGLAHDFQQSRWLVLSWLASFGTLCAVSLVSWRIAHQKRGGENSPRVPSPELAAGGARMTRGVGTGPSGRQASGGPLFTSVAGPNRLHAVSPWRQRPISVSDALARRDFVYGVFVLALIQRLEWFLWASAIGANLYALSLLLIGQRQTTPDGNPRYRMFNIADSGGHQ